MKIKKILGSLIFCSCLITNAQNNLEIIGTIVNKQNTPIEHAAVSIPSAFLRTVTSQGGKFNLSLVNMDYEIDDVIKISGKDNDEIIEITIGDYLKLDEKKIVMKSGNVAVVNRKKTIEKNKKKSTIITETRKTTLALENIKEGDQISIKNVKGKTFFKESIATSNLKVKKFDLNFLKDGNYFFEIEKESLINVIPFTISFEKGIIYLENKKITHYKPHINVKNETVILTQVSQNGEPITVNIFDENNQLLFKDTTKNETSFQRAFKLKKGSFKFVITTNNNQYERQITTYD